LLKKLAHKIYPTFPNSNPVISRPYYFVTPFPHRVPLQLADSLVGAEAYAYLPNFGRTDKEGAASQPKALSQQQALKVGCILSPL
jgi:hypothetical protein